MIGIPDYVPPISGPMTGKPDLRGMLYFPPNHNRIRSGYYTTSSLGALLKAVLRRGARRGSVEAGTIRFIADMMD